MPANKDFKRVVRARMRKTGESYTAARAVLLQQPSAHRPARAPGPDEYSRLAGVSDDTIKARTGCTWARWVRALDRVEAWRWPHPRIASYIRETWKTPSWWTQTVAVGYERIKGLRAAGQQRDGSWRVSRSRTFALPAGRLYRAFSEARTRERWLPGAVPSGKTTRNQRIRFRWPDGSRLEVAFVVKAPGKTVVALEQGPLPDRATADRLRAFWSVRLDALGREAAAGGQARRVSARAPARKKAPRA